MPMSNPFFPMASATPNSEDTTGKAGTSGAVADADHVHPRISVAIGGLVLGANGTVDVPFGKSFPKATPPVCAPPLLEESADNQPVSFKRVAWLYDAGQNNIIGCTIKGYRMRKLPAVMTLLNDLLNYDCAAGNAVGAKFDLVVLKAS